MELISGDFMRKVLTYLILIGGSMAQHHNQHDITWLKDQDIPKVQKPLMKIHHVDSKDFQIIAICGTKGAEKTSTTTKLVEKLKNAGLYVQVFAPFQEMNKIYEQEKGGYGKLTSSLSEAREVFNKHKQLVEQRITSFEQELLNSSYQKGVLIFDREWLTILTSLVVAKDMSDVEQRTIWRDQWMNRIYPTAFIEANPMRTFERRQGQLGIVSGLPTDEFVWSDYFQRKLLAARFKDWIFAHHDTSYGINDAKVDAMATDISSKIIAAFNN